MFTLNQKLSVWWLLAALSVGVHPALAQVTNLGIAPAGNQSMLFWPATVVNSVLLSTTNLASPNWMTVSDAVPVTAVAVNNTFPARFFLLVPNAAADGMVYIPAGTFTMGNSTTDTDITDAAPVSVTVSGFYMETNLVSYGQWQSVFNWGVGHGYGFAHPGAGKAANHPVYLVDWYDAVKWSNGRSQQAGLTPVYYTDAGFQNVYTNGEVIPYVNWAASGYRLPTEAEWEKAARGGLSGQRFPWGDTISEGQANYYAWPANFIYDLGPYTGDNTNFDTGGRPFTSPVGYFAPNGYGVFDMAGNDNEWCWDWFGPVYAGGVDPRGPATGTDRVQRGGY